MSLASATSLLAFAAALLHPPAAVLAQQGAEQARATNELKPVESAFTEFSPEYRMALQRVLWRGAPAPKGSCVRVLVCPSMERECLLTLYRSDAGWRAHVVQPDDFIWSAVQGKRDLTAIKKRVSERPIPDELAKRITTAVVAMLLRTRYEPPRDTPDLVDDGVVHTFFGWEAQNGNIEGQTHSPEPGTRPELLVKLADACIAFVLAGDEHAATALAEVETATGKLEEALAKLPVETPVKR